MHFSNKSQLTIGLMLLLRRPAAGPRSQGPTVGFLVGGAQLLPVERGLRSTQSRRLSEGSLGVDVEIAVMRMLLAKVIARLRSERIC